MNLTDPSTWEWRDITTAALFAGLFIGPAILLYVRRDIEYRLAPPPPANADPLDMSSTAADAKPAKPVVELAPPKDDPFTLDQLKQYDGSDPSKAIYVAIKGTVFDVTNKREMYGPGGSYNVFAGKDGSKGLGSSSLKPEDATADYTGLSEKELGVLNDWHSFFSKRYNIVGKVTQ